MKDNRKSGASVEKSTLAVARDPREVDGWYVGRVSSEGQAKDRLERAGFAVTVPMRRALTIVCQRGKAGERIREKRLEPRPLWPGYVFLKPGEGADWRALDPEVSVEVTGTRKRRDRRGRDIEVPRLAERRFWCHVLEGAEGPILLSEARFARIMAIAEGGAFDDVVLTEGTGIAAWIRAGARAVIAAGPLQGIHVMIEAIETGRQLVKVATRGRRVSLPIRVEAAFLEKVGDDGLDKAA